MIRRWSRVHLLGALLLTPALARVASASPAGAPYTGSPHTAPARAVRQAAARVRRPPETFFLGGWAEADAKGGVAFYLRLRVDGRALMGSATNGLAAQAYDLDPWISPPMITFTQPDGRGPVFGRVWVVSADTIVLAVNVSGGPVPRDRAMLNPQDFTLVIHTLVRVPEDRLEVTEEWIRLQASAPRPPARPATHPVTPHPVTLPRPSVRPRVPMIHPRAPTSTPTPLPAQ